MSNWLSAKINALGEKVMDSVLDAVASNQETHLKQLQHMQQWSVSRLFNRVVNAKYFYRQSNVAPCAAFEEVFPASRPLSQTVAAASPSDSHKAASSIARPLATPRGSTGSSSGSSSSSSRAPSGCNTEESVTAAVSSSPLFPQSQQLQPLQQQQQPRQNASLLPHFIPREAVGKLYIEVPGACLLLFSGEGVRSNPLQLQRERHQQQLTWLLRVLVENQQQQSRTVRLNTRGGSEGVASTNCVNELPFEASFEFPVRDLWTDVSLEIICIRPCRHIILKATKDSVTAAAAAAGANSRSGSSPAPPLEDVSGISAAAAAGRLAPQQQRDLLMQQLQQQFNSLPDECAAASSSSSSSRLQQQQQQQQQKQLQSNPGPLLASTDLAPSDAIPSLDERQLYGRVIVPLSSFLRAALPTQKQEKEQLQQGGGASWPWFGSAGWVSEGDFWAHLYPDNKKQQERKYLRPVRGFEEYGMKNPVSSLGFLHLRLRFEWLRPPLAASLLSMCLPPSSVWLVPSSPEPHYVQTFGERCRRWGDTEPRWVTKFLKLSSPSYLRCSPLDWMLVGTFWLLLFFTFVFARPQDLPLSISLCIALISLSYRYSDAQRETTSPCCSSALVVSNSFVNASKNGGGSGGQVEEQPTQEQRLVPLPVLHCSTRFLPSAAPQREASELLGTADGAWSFSGEMLMQPKKTFAGSASPSSCGGGAVGQPPLTGSGGFVTSACRSGEYANNNSSNSSSSSNGSRNSLAQAQQVQPTGALVAVDSPAGGGKNFSQPEAASQGGAVEGRIIGSRNSEAAPVATRKAANIGGGGGSVVQSPFGGLRVSVHTKPSGGEEWPVFADDETEPLLAQQLQNIVELFTILQLFFGYTAQFLDKLKYAFNWEDPLLTFGSVVLLLLHGTTLTLLLQLCSFVPFRWWRFVAFCCTVGLAALQSPTAKALVSRELDKTEAHKHRVSGENSAEGAVRDGSLAQQEASTLPSVPPLEAAAAAPSSPSTLRGKGVSHAQHKSWIEGFLRRRRSSARHPEGKARKEKRLETADLKAEPPRRVAKTGRWALMGFLHRYLTGPLLCAAENATVSYFGLVAFWWLHLPEQREIEHRQIAVSQLLPSLSVLLPRDEREAPTARQQQQQQQAAGDTTGGSSGSATLPTASGAIPSYRGGFVGEESSAYASKQHGIYTRDVYAFLRRYSRSRWQRENPVTAQLYAAAPYLMPRRSSSIGFDEQQPQHPGEEIHEASSITSLPSELQNTCVNKSPSFPWGVPEDVSSRQLRDQQDKQQPTTAALSEKTSAPGQDDGVSNNPPQQDQPKGLSSLSNLTAQGAVDQLVYHPEFLSWQRRLFERGQQVGPEEMSDEEQHHAQHAWTQPSQEPLNQQQKQAETEQQQLLLQPQRQQTSQESSSGPFGALAFPGLKAFFGRKHSFGTPPDEEAWVAVCRRDIGRGMPILIPTPVAGVCCCSERDLSKNECGATSSSRFGTSNLGSSNATHGSMPADAPAAREEQQHPVVPFVEEEGACSSQEDVHNEQSGEQEQVVSGCQLDQAAAADRNSSIVATEQYVDAFVLPAGHATATPAELRGSNCSEHPETEEPGAAAVQARLVTGIVDAGNPIQKNRHISVASTKSPVQAVLPLISSHRLALDCARAFVTAAQAGAPGGDSIPAACANEHQQADQLPQTADENQPPADLWERGQQHAQLALQQLHSVQRQLMAMEEQQTVLARRALQLPSPEDPQSEQQQSFLHRSDVEVSPLESSAEEPHVLQNLQRAASNDSSTSPRPNIPAGSAKDSSQEQQHDPTSGSGLWSETVSFPLGLYKQQRARSQQDQYRRQQGSQPQHRYFSSSIPDLSRLGWLAGSSDSDRQQADNGNERSNSIGFLTDADSFSAAFASLGHLVESLGWSLASTPPAVTTPEAAAHSTVAVAKSPNPVGVNVESDLVVSDAESGKLEIVEGS
ncbi:uncharacterized protein LOC34622686 [Cyclospora cayetanensis]|uniref:Uncharacterized protein LOC34622686 n=1 Tax=Cyclospora cayetanensis TaxID=88456 RepID=A0A6P6RU56_9EIME|nr:uncharacterized protein LOC34622686 [Cyclospora cayetanensis]